MASIVDRPKESHQQDLLEIEKYTEGLIRFIRASETPITIGIQGEWGSGKTSLLNTIKEQLCEGDSAENYGVWVNTWEYSLLSTPDETLVKIISGLVHQISGINAKSDSSKKKKVYSALGKLIKNTTSQVGGIAATVGNVVGDTIIDAVEEKEDNSISALRNALQDVINETLKSSIPKKKTFIFFIDDLDRLDPTIAVNILELIKNLFDLENCIFILAIDYGVVVKGLQSKFGRMTEENEWEFRAFFDKIIQLPFSMPIASYNTSKYLKVLLTKIGYFQQEDLQDEEIVDKISDVVTYSVGTNPRALKRLVNSVALIDIIRGDDPITTEEKITEFALICAQIAYPFIYSLIQKNPDFVSWDEQFVYSILKNKKIDETDLKGLEETEEFDEEWEKNLWRICQINSFLKTRVFLVSRLLNFIRDNIPLTDNIPLGEGMEKILKASSVTSVNTDATNTAGKAKYQKTRYDTLEEYTSFLTGNSIPDNVIKKITSYIESIEQDNGEHLVVNYSNAFIGFRSDQTKGRVKNFAYIEPQKKGIWLGILHHDAYSDLYPEGGKQSPSNPFVRYKLDHKNTLTTDDFLPILKKMFAYISTQ